MPPKLAEVLRDNRKLQAQLEKEEARTELILEAIETAIAKITPPVFQAKPHGPGDAEEAVLLLGDWHFGEIVDKSDTMGRNVYNHRIACKRMAYFVNRVRRLVSIHRHAYPLSALNVMMLGDIVTGETIYEGQQFALDQPVIDQAFDGANMLAAAINEWSAEFETIRVHTVNGNHGRSGARGRNHPKTNWDEVLYRTMAAELKDNDRVQFNIHQEPIAVVRINGLRGAISHGSVLARGSPLMDTVMDRAVATWPDKVGGHLDWLAFGHFHSCSTSHIGGVKVFANASAVGSTSYSVNGRMRFNPPMQWLFGAHPKRTTWEYPINLS